MNYPGNFRGRVVDTNDPLKKGRVRVEIPELGSQTEEDDPFVSLWSPVNLPGHTHDIPDVGEMVRVNFGPWADNPSDAIVSGVETRERADGSALIPCPARGEEDFPADLGTNSTTRTNAVGDTIQFTNSGGEPVTFTEPQSQFDPTTAYPRLSAKERSGLRWEFDPASGRAKIQTPSGAQAEIANGLNAKANFVNLTTRGNYQRFVMGDDVKDVRRGRFIRARTEKVQLDSREVTVARDKLVAQMYEEEIRLQRLSTVSGVRKDVTRLKHIVDAGMEYSLSTLKEIRTIGGYSSRTICGAVSTAPGAVTPGVPGVFPIDISRFLLGDSSETFVMGNKNFTFTPLSGGRVRIGPGDPVSGIVANPPAFLNQAAADLPFAPLKGAFATSLLAYFTTMSGAMKAFLATLTKTAGLCGAAAVAVESLPATNGALSVSAAQFTEIAVAFTDLAVMFAAMNTQFAVLQGGFDAYIAQYITEVGLLPDWASTWMSNYLAVW